MRFGSWQFDPGPWPTLATVVVVPLLAALGFWQLDRADQKEQIHRTHLRLAAAAPLDLNRASPQGPVPGLTEFRRVTASGHFDPGVTYLLDNQVLDGEPGYFVYTPFVLAANGLRALVNRGWIAGGPDRSRIPAIATPTAEINVQGVARVPGRPGIRLGDTVVEELGDGRRRVEVIDLAAIGAANGWRLLPFEIRLDPASAAGFVRRWVEPGSGKERHLGYAFQWFAMAVTVVVIYLWLNLKRETRA